MPSSTSHLLMINRPQVGRPKARDSILGVFKRSDLMAAKTPRFAPAYSVKWNVKRFKKSPNTFSDLWPSVMLTARCIILFYLFREVEIGKTFVRKKCSSNETTGKSNREIGFYNTCFGRKRQKEVMRSIQ